MVCLTPCFEHGKKVSKGKVTKHGIRDKDKQKRHGVSKKVNGIHAPSKTHPKKPTEYADRSRDQGISGRCGRGALCPWSKQGPSRQSCRLPHFGPGMEG